MALAAPPANDCRDGCPHACGQAVDAADALKAAGHELTVVCLTGLCRSSCLEDLATPGSFETQSTWDTTLERQESLAWASELRVRFASVRDILASNMQIDLATVDPQGTYDPDQKALRWDGFDARGRAAIAFNYATTPIRPGRTTTSAFVDGSILDTLGGSAGFRVSVQEITAADRLLTAFLPWAAVPITSPQPFSIRR
jgi:hypothetical protein